MIAVVSHTTTGLDLHDPSLTSSSSMVDEACKQNLMNTGLLTDEEDDDEDRKPVQQQHGEEDEDVTKTSNCTLASADSALGFDESNYSSSRLSRSPPSPTSLSIISFGHQAKDSVVSGGTNGHQQRQKTGQSTYLGKYGGGYSTTNTMPSSMLSPLNTPPPAPQPATAHAQPTGGSVLTTPILKTIMPVNSGYQHQPYVSYQKNETIGYASHLPVDYSNNNSLEFSSFYPVSNTSHSTPSSQAPFMSHVTPVPVQSYRQHQPTNYYYPQQQPAQAPPLAIMTSGQVNGAPSSMPIVNQYYHQPPPMAAPPLPVQQPMHHHLPIIQAFDPYPRNQSLPTNYHQTSYHSNAAQAQYPAPMNPCHYYPAPPVVQSHSQPLVNMTCSSCSCLFVISFCILFPIPFSHPPLSSSHTLD